MNFLDNISGYFSPFKKENRPKDLFPQRVGVDPQVMRDAEAVREMRNLELQGLLTADTGVPVMLGKTVYNGSGIDPASAYYMRGEDKGPYYENIPSGYTTLPDASGVQPRELLPQDEADRLVLGISTYNPGYANFGQLASDWYSSKGHPDSAERAQMLAQEAINAGLDPYIALALGAQEGTWMKDYSPDAPYNYLGWGETNSGSQGRGANSLEEWLPRHLPDIAKQYGTRDKLTDWGGSSSGYSAESPFEYRYNYNDSWTWAIASLIGELDRYRRANYPDLMGPTIDYGLPQL
jgi:hypothetical protein